MSPVDDLIHKINKKHHENTCENRKLNPVELIIKELYNRHTRQEGDASASELARKIRRDLSKVNKILKKLEESGIIESRQPEKKENKKRAKRGKIKKLYRLSIKTYKIIKIIREK